MTTSPGLCQSWILPGSIADLDGGRGQEFNPADFVHAHPRSPDFAGHTDHRTGHPRTSMRSTGLIGGLRPPLAPDAVEEVEEVSNEDEPA